MNQELMNSLINLAYLVAAVLFILGLKGLAHPRTAVRGNLIGAVGMLLAVVVTLFDQHVLRFEVILAGIVLGSAVGAVLALKIQMTAMPQMVALFNGFGGAGSFLVAGLALVVPGLVGEGSHLQSSVSTAASGIVGAVTLWGSLVAFAKLQEFLIPGNPVLFRGQHAINAVIFLVAVVFGTFLVVEPSFIDPVASYWIMVAVASVLGVLLVIPIGGADMPVVIALLNSYSGIAAASTGFVLNNNVLIIAGS
ncbi:MAG: NAD(P)(+) transhydrogenase (Re/Si-specific) subunit beta, partial [Candidatus Glassbacteria bacterium]|nr:NAD(P)(+) transhydrogenase (Re/Si-specific) subunit beta [Candidatus Glassbacteria bacterium]